MPGIKSQFLPLKTCHPGHNLPLFPSLPPYSAKERTGASKLPDPSSLKEFLKPKVRPLSAGHLENPALSNFSFVFAGTSLSFYIY